MPQPEDDEGDALRRRYSTSSKDEPEAAELRSSINRRLEHTHTFGRFMTDGDILRYLIHFAPAPSAPVEGSSHAKLLFSTSPAVPVKPYCHNSVAMICVGKQASKDQELRPARVSESMAVQCAM